MNLNHSESDFLDLIDTIYDAAVSPDAWQDVLSALHLQIPMTGIDLHGTHRGPNPSYFFVQQGYDPDAVSEFISTYAELSPWPELMPQFSTGEIFIPNFCRVTDRFHPTDYYSFMRRKDIGAGVAAVLSNEPDRTFHLTVDYSLKDETKLVDPVRKFLGKVAPHLARSFAIFHKTALARNGFGSLKQMIKQLAMPAILVDSALKVRACNEPGEALFKTGSGLKRDGCERLSLEDVSADTVLRQAVKSITNFELTNSTPTGIAFRSVSAPLPGRITAVPLKADNSLSPGSLAHHLACPERLALLVVNVGSADDIALDKIFRIRFGLTAAQSKLARALCAGMSLDQYAVKNGNKISTVRSHLRALFEKTDTHQQSQLVALLMENGASW